MKSRHDFDAAKVSKLSAHAADTFTLFQKISECRVSHDDDHFRLNRGDFSKQKRAADRGLFQSGLAIARRAAAINIANDHVLTLHAHRLDHLSEQLSGAADKRFALRIPAGARRLTDKHQARGSISVRVN